MWIKHLKFTLGIVLILTLILPYALISNYLLLKESQPLSSLIDHIAAGIEVMKQDIYL